MKRRRMVLSIVLIFIAGAVTVLALSFRKNRLVIQEQELGPLLTNVQEAKARGETQMTTGGSEIELTRIQTNLDELLAMAKVVVAQPIQEKSIAPSNSLFTWYKLKIVETLVPNNPICTACTGGADPPSELLPVGSDEFFKYVPGGTVAIDGVTVTEPFNDDSPPLQVGQKYLVFFGLYPSGLAKAHPDFIFRVNADNTLTPINNRLHQVKTEMQERFGNSLNQLRTHLQQQ